MNINDELKRLGESPASPEEEADAQRLDEQMERLRGGEWAIPEGDPNAQTITWMVDHVQTAVCSVIAVVELTGGYQRLAVAQPKLIVTFALMAAILYLMMSYPLALLARQLERRPHATVA